MVKPKSGKFGVCGSTNTPKKTNQEQLMGIQMAPKPIQIEGNFLMHTMVLVFENLPVKGM